jgi:hypothetical protein
MQTQQKKLLKKKTEQSRTRGRVIEFKSKSISIRENRISKMQIEVT